MRPLLHRPPEEDPAAEAGDHAVVEVVHGSVAAHAATLAQEGGRGGAGLQGPVAVAVGAVFVARKVHVDVTTVTDAMRRNASPFLFPG